MKSAVIFLIMVIAAVMPVVQAQGLQPELSVVVSRYDPFPAEPDRYMTLWIKVQNTGPVPARNVTLELLDTYPFSLDASEERVRSYGELQVTEPVLAEYRVRVDSGALDGRNPIDLKISSDGRDFFIKILDINVESKIVDFAIGSLLSEPERLVSDTENNKLTINLQNIGEGDAKLVRTELMLPEGFTPSDSYSDEYAIGTIISEGSGTAIFYIDIDRAVQAEEHLATMKVSYKDEADGEYKRKTLQVRIPVRSSPSFEITGVEISPETLGQGMKDVELRLDMMNSGTREAENVNVRVLKEATQPFDFDEKSNFVGNLGPNEAGQAVFHFDIDSTADLKKYIMDIEIRYTTDSTVNIADDRISLEVTEQLPDSTGLYIFLIIFLVIVGIVIWFIRK
jgi:hypothetical protein